MFDEGTLIFLWNALKGSGGGGEPSAYLKTIVKDETNHTITITDKQGNATTFEFGGGITNKLIHEYTYTNGETSLNGTSNEGV